MAETRSARSPRAQWVLDHYRIEELPGGIYRAVALGRDGRVYATIEGPDKAEVCRQARANWGHMNYHDEAVAFSEIFPPHYGAQR